MKNEIILTCKKVVFYSRKDENSFFEWIKKVDCIENFSAQGDELYLNISNTLLLDNDLRDLLALFYRYKIDMKQLKQFLHDKNRSWFFLNKKAYWYRYVFES